MMRELATEMSRTVLEISIAIFATLAKSSYMAPIMWKMRTGSHNERSRYLKRGN